MARKKTLCRASNGLYVRNIGWKQTAGGYAQHKFYLGRDEEKATLASLRLEQLWKQVTAFWRATDWDEELTDRPVWRDLTLILADAIRNGETVARVPLPADLQGTADDGIGVSLWLDDMRQSYPVIRIELLDEEEEQKAAVAERSFAEWMIEKSQRMLYEPGGGETLHAALDAYARWIETKYLSVERRLTAWGGTKKRQVKFIRRHLPDGSLTQLDSQRIEELIDVLRLRPLGENGEPVSVSWAQGCIKLFRHFLRWLNRSPAFAWRRPEDFELARVQIPRSPQEKAAAVRNAQVQTYSLDELRLLWVYANSFQRVLMLLGLNCGFGRAELASLETADVILGRKHPHEQQVGCHSTAEDNWIFRVRHKSGVYGEWKLWPETAAAIDWWLRQRATITVAEGVTTLLVTRKGHRYDAPTKGNHMNFQIPNNWFSLADRIRKDHPTFRRLSFNKLRKTAGDMIRAEAGGEVAAVFLCHGTPVKSDELLDLYTNRPFAKVFEATERVGEKLRAIWTEVEEPFAEGHKHSKRNITPGVIKRIQSMKGQGYKVAYIAEKLDVSTETVRRWANRLAMPGGLPDEQPLEKADDAKNHLTSDG
jgi:hypothetical protein